MLLNSAWKSLSLKWGYSFLIYTILSNKSVLVISYVNLNFKSLSNSGLLDLGVNFTQLISSVQALRCVQLFVTPWITSHQVSLSIINYRSLLKLMSIETVMSSNYLTLGLPLLLPPSIFPRIRVFSNESVLPISWSKYWSFSFNISSSNEYSGLIYFRMDWLDLLTVQGTLKNLLQHHSSKASILWHSTFFLVQLLHLYMTTGKTITLTRQTAVGKVMSLLFNMLSMLVITFLPRSVFNFIAAVTTCSDFGAQKYVNFNIQN